MNGQAVDGVQPCGTYVTVQRVWQAGDVVELSLPMPIRLMESHPAVVANRNRAAVMRGPLLYCVEAPLAADGERIWRDGIYFPEHMTVTPRFEKDLLGGITVLRAEALTEARQAAIRRGRCEQVRPAGGFPKLGRSTVPQFGSTPFAAARVGHHSAGLDPVLCLGKSGRGLHASLDPTRALK